MHPEVSTFARARVAGVRGAFIIDAQTIRRELLFESGSNPLDECSVHAWAEGS